MAVSVNQILANTLGLADPLGRIADDGRVGFNGRVNINGRPIRFAPNFDSVDDYGVLANRAINPDGDIDIEFETGAIVPAAGGIEYTVMSQCLTATFASKEFNLYFNSTIGALQMQVGGSYSPSSATVVLAPNTKYRALLQGTSLQFFRNGQSLFSASFTRGAAREPTAQTVLMASTHGTPITFRAFGRGIFYNVRVNGVLWRMADRNQAIQLPEPSGLGAELITPSVLENPAVKGSQWTYLGGGRWQYVGDGSLNELQFILSGAQPSSGFVEFEVESYSGAGSMTCSITAAGNPVNSLFNSVGVKRYFFTDKGVSNANTFVFKRASGSASCIIKNISFKPLGACNPMTLVNVTSDRWQEVAQ